jgi:hypothetical protein
VIRFVLKPLLLTAVVEMFRRRAGLGQPWIQTP